MQARMAAGNSAAFKSSLSAMRMRAPMAGRATP
jgi:hypothetical protein